MTGCKLINPVFGSRQLSKTSLLQSQTTSVVGTVDVVVLAPLVSLVLPPGLVELVKDAIDKTQQQVKLWERYRVPDDKAVVTLKEDLVDTVVELLGLC